jgi:hypothetical protein
MATKLENTELDIAHFLQLQPYIKGAECWSQNTIRDLLRRGMLQVSTAFEHAVADTIGCEVISTDEADLSNGGDCKLATVRTSSYGRRYSGPVASIYNKTGTLYVQLFERIQYRFYYFAIPHEAYQDIPKSSNIEIAFERNGDPRRINNSQINWWDYEQPGFIEMCSVVVGDHFCNNNYLDRKHTMQEYRKLYERQARRPVFEKLFE